MKLRLDKVKEAIKESAGNLSIIARRCGVERVTLYKFLEKNPIVKEWIKDEEESLFDLCEAKTVQRVRDGDKWAIDRVLSSVKARHRGWSQYSEQKNVTENSEEVTKRIDRLRQLNKEDYDKVCGVMGWTEDL